MLKSIPSRSAIEVQAQEPLEVQAQELIKTPPGVEVDSVQEQIAQATETSPGVEVDPVSLATDRVEVWPHRLSAADSEVN